MVNYGANIQSLRAARNITQKNLAEILGISRAALAHYESNRREPDLTTLCKIADFFDISIDYILDRTQNEKINTNINIPLLSTTTSIEKNNIDYDKNNIEKYIELPTNIKADFAFRIKEDTMIWAGIHPGDIALAKINLPPSHGKIVVCKDINTNHFSLKYYITKNEKVLLETANPACKDRELKPAENIFGCVVFIIKHPPSVQAYRNLMFEKNLDDINWQKVKEKSASYGLNSRKLYTLINLADKIRTLEDNDTSDFDYDGGK